MLNACVLQDGFAVAKDAVPAARVEELAAALAGLGGGYGMRNLLQNCPAVSALAAELKPWVTPWLGHDR